MTSVLLYLGITSLDHFILYPLLNDHILTKNLPLLFIPLFGFIIATQFQSYQKCVILITRLCMLSLITFSINGIMNATVVAPHIQYHANVFLPLLLSTIMMFSIEFLINDKYPTFQLIGFLLLTMVGIITTLFAPISFIVLLIIFFFYYCHSLKSQSIFILASIIVIVIGNIYTPMIIPLKYIVLPITSLIIRLVTAHNKPIHMTSLTLPYVVFQFFIWIPRIVLTYSKIS